MRHEIKNRFTGEIIFTADIEANENSGAGVRLGLAVKVAYKSNADLNGAYLRGADLRNADLRGADLSNAYLRGADLRGADLNGADLRGADLRGAYLNGADLRGAYLNGAYLRGAYLNGAYLRGADLSDAYLRGADLSGADLSNAYLRNADLRDAYLRGADLSDAYLNGAYLRECPVKIESIHKRVYEAASKEGALDMGSWHKNGHCGTTHCRAGWVVFLAGEGGRALEWFYGTSIAAAFIYMASDPELEKIPNFYASNEDALTDMKRLAEKG